MLAGLDVKHEAARRERRLMMRAKLSRLWFSTLCLTAVAVLSMTLFGVWRARQDQCLFALKTLTVESRFAHLSAEQIRAAIKTQLDAGFFSIDLGATRAQLKALPWVAQVEVRKRWPETVFVRVVERNAIALWGENELLDTKGEAFRADGAGAISGLVSLRGPDSRRAELLMFYRNSEPMLRNLSLNLTHARFSKRGALTLRLSDGSKIILGREQQPARWQRFIENLPTLRAKNPGQRLIEVDLRYTNGLAARFEGPSSAAPPSVPAPPQPAATPRTAPAGPAVLAGTFATTPRLTATLPMETPR
jgi:cell division protein FtsQ